MSVLNQILVNILWFPVPDTKEKYFFNEYGDIYSIASKRNLAKKKDKDGYHCAGFYVDGLFVYKKVHRLVAFHFIPNPENKPTVNHKDGNKLNNHKNNLEWATYAEQSYHSINILKQNRQTDKKRLSSSLNGIKSRKPIVAFDAKTNKMLWRSDSCVQGCMEHGFVRGSVSWALIKGVSHKGILFKYELSITKK